MYHFLKKHSQTKFGNCIYKANNVKYLNVLYIYTPDIFTIYKVIQKRTSTKRGKYTLQSSNGSVFDGYGTTSNRRKTFYKNELLQRDEDSTQPSKIKTMNDANVINLVATRTNEIPIKVRSEEPKEPERPRRKRKTVKFPVRIEPLKQPLHEVADKQNRNAYLAGHCLLVN